MCRFSAIPKQCVSELKWNDEKEEKENNPIANVTITTKSVCICALYFVTTKMFDGTVWSSLSVEEAACTTK